MQDAIADMVHPVFSQGLRVLDQLKRGEHLDFAAEQAKLMRLLSPDAAQRYPEYVGDGNFLGIRYALACWLDEMFILDSPWKTQWEGRSLEWTLYNSMVGGNRFWSQFDEARARPSNDSAEVFFLCVMLGFRGDKRDQPEGLAQVIEGARNRIAQLQSREPDLPPEKPVTYRCEPRTGQEELRSMVKICGSIAVVLVPIVVFLLMFIASHHR